MPIDPDHYEIYYADKLWNLLPAFTARWIPTNLGKNQRPPARTRQSDWCASGDRAAQHRPILGRPVD